MAAMWHDAIPRPLKDQNIDHGPYDMLKCAFSR
jgi:hypothetical protein